MTYQYMELKIKELEKRIEVLEQKSKIGHCKDCKWWKDSDGGFRRGIGAESKCHLNTDVVYEGLGYCYMFEPQETESEDELKDLSKRVENIEKQMKEDREEQLKKLQADLDYAKFCCALNEENIKGVIGNG